MIKFKLNSKTVEIASSWDDLSFRSLLKWLACKGETHEAISICTGIDSETIKNAEIPNLETILQAIQFLNTPANFQDTVTQIGKYKLPLDSKGQFNPQFKRLDQFEDMRKAMVFGDKGIVEVTKAYAKYVAIYLQSIRDGVYKYDSAMEMVEEIMDMPAKEVIPAGSFFLIKVLTLSNGIKKTSPNTNQTKKKPKRGLKNSRKPSARSRRS